MQDLDPEKRREGYEYESDEEVFIPELFDKDRYINSPKRGRIIEPVSNVYHRKRSRSFLLRSQKEISIREKGMCRKWQNH